MKIIDGRYEIVEKIGDGGMGEVYRAMDVRLRRPVALKRLNLIGRQSDLEQFLARFQREAIAMASLQHPNIAPIYDYGEYEQFPYLVMAYLPGGTLKERMGKHFNPRKAAQILRPVADALDFIHSHQMIHRDVKPSNILFSERDDPLLADFGVVKLLEESGATLTGLGGVGTPAYMAPEQIRKDFDWCVDQYALGIIFYEMLTGVKPFEGDTPMETLWKHNVEPLKDPRTFEPAIPEEYCRVLETMLAKNPDDRYAVMDEVVDVLARLARGEALAAEPTPAEAAAVDEDAKPTELAMPVVVEADETVLDAIPRGELLAQQAQEIDLEARGEAEAAGGETELDHRIEEIAVPTELAMAVEEVIPAGESRSTAPAKQRFHVPVWAIAVSVVVVLAVLGIIFRQEVAEGVNRLGALIVNPTPAPTRTPRPTVTRKPTQRPTHTPKPELPSGTGVLREVDGAEMVFVRSGAFIMGLSDPQMEWILTQPWCEGCSPDLFNPERPEHEVLLSSYWIDRYEVTNEQFAHFVEATGHITVVEEQGGGQVPAGPDTIEWKWLEGASWRNPLGPFSSLEGMERSPVVQVSWFDAAAYCEWVGGRLPTEAEWEHAARGDTRRLYPWGNELPNPELANVMYFHDQILPVESFPEGGTPYGVMGMTGNVAEWMLDTYHPDFYGEGFQENPIGPGGEGDKVVRGGSYRTNEIWSMSIKRGVLPPHEGYSTLGFRCVMPAR